MTTHNFKHQSFAEDDGGGALPVVVGIFGTKAGAEQAINELQDAGFDEKNIGFMAREGTREGSIDGDGVARQEQRHESTLGAPIAVVGAMSGSATGGLLGAVAGMFIPGYGAAAVAGLVGGALLGGASGGLLGALVALGIPEQNARYYQYELEKGAALVAVRETGRREEVLALLRRHGAYNLTTQKDSALLAD